MVQVFPGISMDPDIRFGKPCVADTRIDVATVVGAVGAGDSIEAVQDAYELTRDQVLAALRYAGPTAAAPPSSAERPYPINNRKRDREDREP